MMEPKGPCDTTLFQKAVDFHRDEMMKFQTLLARAKVVNAVSSLIRVSAPPSSLGLDSFSSLNAACDSNDGFNNNNGVPAVCNNKGIVDTFFKYEMETEKQINDNNNNGVHKRQREQQECSPSTGDDESLGLQDASFDDNDIPDSLLIDKELEKLFDLEQQQQQQNRKLALEVSSSNTQSQATLEHHAATGDILVPQNTKKKRKYERKKKQPSDTTDAEVKPKRKYTKRKNPSALSSSSETEKSPPLEYTPGKINLNGYPFDSIVERQEQKDLRISNIKAIVQTLERNKSLWEKASLQQQQQVSTEVTTTTTGKAPNRKYYRSIYNECIDDWVSKMEDEINKWHWLTYSMRVDSDTKQKWFKGPNKDSLEKCTDNKEVVSVPKDRRCTGCRRFYLTSDPSSCKPLSFVLCQCEKRRSSLCIRCRILRWLLTLPTVVNGDDDETSKMVMPFDPESGDIQSVPCPGSRCKIRWSPIDICILDVKQRLYDQDDGGGGSVLINNITE